MSHEKRMKTKYIIYFDAGYGKEYILCSAHTDDDAQQIAYEECRGAAESNADYGIVATNPTPDDFYTYSIEDQ